jgi:PAS domain S-box-containing protein
MGQGLLTLGVDRKISYVNPAAESLLGWSHEQLSGRAMAGLIAAGEDGVSASTPGNEALLSAVSDGASISGDDVVFLRRDGTEFPVAYTAAPFETATGVQGRVVVFEDISERKAYEDSLRRDVEKLTWIGRVQAALAEDRFELHAQPIIDLRTGSVVQQELLLRMRDVDGTIIGPPDFLPIAEKYGLIGEIDWWVIEQGVAIAARGSAVEITCRRARCAIRRWPTTSTVACGRPVRIPRSWSSRSPRRRWWRGPTSRSCWPSISASSGAASPSMTSAAATAAFTTSSTSRWTS